LQEFTRLDEALLQKVEKRVKKTDTAVSVFLSDNFPDPGYSHNINRILKSFYFNNIKIDHTQYH